MGKGRFLPKRFLAGTASSLAFREGWAVRFVAGVDWCFAKIAYALVLGWELFSASRISKAQDCLVEEMHRFSKKA